MFALTPLLARLLAVAGVLAVLVAAGFWLHGRWVDEGKAIVQVELDKANRDLGTALAANATNEATIRAIMADKRADEELLDHYAARVTALTQQADDTAAAIRKLQADDQTVADYLRTPIPDALRSLLNHGRAAAGPVGAADRDGAAPAAQAVHPAVPRAR